MSQRLAILHLTLSFATGGRRTAIETLTQASSGQSIHYLAVLNDFEAEEYELTPYFKEYLALNRSDNSKFSVLSKLADFCKNNAIQVIHAHDAASQMAGALIRLRFPNIRLIMTFHRSLAMESATAKDKLRNALSCFLSHKIICASRERQTHFIAENFLPSSKVLLIPLGVNVKAFESSIATRTEQRKQLEIADSTFVVGVIGHFGEEKGVDRAISTFKQLLESQEHVDALLLIIGGGNQQRTEQLHQLAKPAAEKIRFLGHRTDVPDLMQAMDCFLHTPRLEAFGLVLIEAMACSLPVIATQVGGIPDIVVNQQTGFLVADNEPVQILNGLKQCFEQADLAKALGNAGHERAVAEFNAHLYGQRYHKLYLQLLK